MSQDARRSWIAHGWTVALPVLLLGKALAPGYVLSYDMVWVPQLSLRGDMLGLGTGLPRAVPSDAVVAVLDNVIPGMLLQKLVLLGALIVVGQGVLRLVGPSLVARVTAISIAIWNPFVVERLWIGHWPVLVGYAVIPWLVVLSRRARESGQLPLGLWFLVPLGCLSASSGLVTAAILLIVGLWGSARGVRLRLAVLAVAANAPWLVAGVLHASAAGAPVSAKLFGLHSEGSLPAPLAALGLGGIWNAEVVPHSQQGALAWIGLIILAGLVAVGWRTWWRRTSRSDAHRLLFLWVLGYGIALLSWLWPDLIDGLSTAVPGAGLLRDGTRYLGLCLPALVVTASAGAQALTDKLDGRGSRVALLVACGLFPVMVMTDAAFGINAQLSPAQYPASWTKARAALASAHGRTGGDVLVLPFASYRAPEWNHRRKVLDPLGRFLTPDYVVSDVLTISGKPVAGDDPRVPKVRTALEEADSTTRASDLEKLGIQYVVIDRGVSGVDRVLAPAGTAIFTNSELEVIQLAGSAAPRDQGVAQVVSLAIGWSAFLGLIVWGVFVGVGGWLRRRQ